MLVKDILEIKNSKRLNGNGEIDYFSISTNNIKGKTLFIPLKGTTDGHNYILNGVENGISGFFVEKSYDDIVKKAISINKDIIVIEVEDCLKALQELASLVRGKLKVPVIALTGSYGKTSQKEMLYSTLETEFNVLTSVGNFNNHIGMPLTLVNYHSEDIVLLELGSNHMGEIAFLRDICKPTITLVTSIGTPHIGNFKSLKNTLKEKTSIAQGSDYFLQNMDDNLLKDKTIKNMAVIKYGVNIDNIRNITYGDKIKYTVNEDGTDYEITINSDLNYLVNYSLCAIKIGLILGMDMENIVKGIDSFRCGNSRMEKIIIGNHIIINDCYNASYETIISGLDYFNNLEAEDKIVVIGDILELGKLSKKIHNDIGVYIYKQDMAFEEIHLVGAEMKKVYQYLKGKGFNVFHYNSVGEVNPNITENKSVYLKASNGVGLKSLVPKNEN